jgi:PAS domain S-box-containing protein
MERRLVQILLVEDDGGNAHLLQDLLAKTNAEEWGCAFDVTHVQGLDRALAAQATGRFDLVLLDLDLPDGQGLTTLRRMMHANLGSPVLVMAGADEKELAWAAVRGGAQNCLFKEHLDARTLAHAVRSAVERQRSEATRGGSGQWFRNVFNHSSIGLYWTTPVGQILMANPALVRMLGFSSFKELASRNLEDEGFAPEHSRAVFRQRLEAEGRITGLESAWVKKDGSMLFVRESAWIVCDGTGEPLYYEGTVEHISDRKRAEAELPPLKSLNERIVQSIADGIALMNIGGDLTFINPAGAAMLGYTAEELVGQPWTTIVPADRHPLVESATERRKQGKSERYETELLCQNGTTLPVLVSASPHLDAQGQFAGTCAVFSDIRRRVEAEQELRQHAAELAALREVGLDIAGQLDLEALLRSIVERAVELVAGQAGGLDLYRPELDALEWAVAVGFIAPPLGGVLHRGEGLSGKIWASDRPLAIDDYQHWEGRSSLYEGYSLRAALGVPIRWGDDFLGVLNVVRDRPTGFSQADMQVLSLFATQAAIAIHNARLFKSERAAAQRLETLYRIGQTLTSTLDPDAILDLLTDEALKATGATHGSVLVAQPELGYFERRSLRGFRLEQKEKACAHPLPLDCGLNGRAYRSGKIVCVDDVQVDPDYYALIPETRSELVMPIIHGGQVVGNLDLQSPAVGALAQSKTDVDLLRALIDQVALALEKAHLYQESQQRLSELTLLFETSATLSASLDVHTLLQAIARQLTTALKSDGCAISLWDQEQDAVVTLLDYTADLKWWTPEPEGTLYRLKDYPCTRRVLTQRQPLALRASEPEADAAEIVWMEGEKVRSLLMVPLIVGDKVIGLLEMMETREERVFTPTEIAMCQTLANQGAAALENARLYDEARRRNRELALLNQIIAASAGGRDSTEILQTACRELALALDVPHAVALLLDASQEGLRVVALHQPPGQPSRSGLLIPLDKEALAQCEKSTAALAAYDALSEAGLAPIRSLMEGLSICSVLVLPLLVDGSKAGSLGLGAGEPRHFTPSEIELAERVAEQVSGALARVRLEETQQRLSTAIEQSPEGVIITDTEGTILYVNPAFERATGYSRMEAIGQTPRLLKSGKQDAEFYHQLWQTIGQAKLWKGRFVNRRKDGNLFIQDATITPVRSQAGEVVNYVATMRDVTREVQLEEQFRQAQKMEAVGRLAGGIAHDFNNLLTVIHLSTRLLERKLYPEDPLVPHVQRIRETGEQASQLVRQLLSFSRQEILQARALDLNGVVGELSLMLRRIIGEDIELVTNLGPDLWPVSADPTQMQQVIVNLAVNARDAMPQGGLLTIRTANLFLDQNYARDHVAVEAGDYVLLEVTDTGQGMDEWVQEHMFEPFFTTKEQGKGTGLGLPTAFGIVKQHQGHIAVRSQVGLGSTFSVYLPRHCPDVRKRETSPQVRVAANGNSSPAMDKASSGQADRPSRPTEDQLRTRETILLVEDETQVRQLAVQILRTEGYRVLEAQDGMEGLQLSEEFPEPIHLLLTDVVMPRMSGLELARVLQTRRPGLEVMYMSGYVSHNLAEPGGPNPKAFLRKPFTVETLTEQVQSALKG